MSTVTVDQLVQRGLVAQIPTSEILRLVDNGDLPALVKAVHDAEEAAKVVPRAI